MTVIRKEKELERIKKYYQNIGKYLEDVRKSKQLSGQQVAEKLGISKQAFRQIEKGEIRLHTYYLDSLMEIYDLSYEDISPKYRKKNTSDQELKEELLFYKNLVIRLNDIIRKQNESLRKVCNDHAKLLHNITSKAAETENVSSKLQKDFDSSLKFLKEAEKHMKKNKD